jgi:cell division protein FtsN
MAAKRNKSQARRNGGGHASMPGWAWLVLGLVLGIGMFLIAPKFLGGDEGFFRPQPDAEAKPPALDAADSDNQPIVEEDETPDGGKTTGKGATTDAAAQEQDYSFYNLLSGEETPISDAELAAKTRAEEARAAREAAARDAADAARDDRRDESRDSRNTNDDGISPDNANRPEPPAAIDAEPAPTRDTTVADAGKTTTEPGASRDARYLLQAGAFAASGDAEALKAKIAFLGLSARVESAQIKDKTVYRVRMGPYGSATELAEAKRKLAGGGLPAMAVKVK